MSAFATGQRSRPRCCALDLRLQQRLDSNGLPRTLPTGNQLRGFRLGFWHWEAQRGSVNRTPFMASLAGSWPQSWRTRPTPHTSWLLPLPMEHPSTQWLHCSKLSAVTTGMAHTSSSKQVASARYRANIVQVSPFQGSSTCCLTHRSTGAPTAGPFGPATASVHHRPSCRDARPSSPG